MKKKKKQNTPDAELIAAVARHLDYLMAEGVVVIDGCNAEGEPLYRLKTDEEIEKEIQEIEEN